MRNPIFQGCGRRGTRFFRRTATHVRIFPEKSTKAGIKNAFFTCETRVDALHYVMAGHQSPSGRVPMKDDKDNQNMEFTEAKDQASFAPLSITVSGEKGNDPSQDDSSGARIIDAPALILGGASRTFPGHIHSPISTVNGMAVFVPSALEAAICDLHL